MNEKILVVDDEKVAVAVLGEMLRMADYNVIEAFDGKEALAKVKNYNPDLILLDVRMPGLTGFEVCKIIKENKDTQNIPIVMVTALKQKDDRIKGIEVGADDFLTKPIDERELLTRVKSLIRIKSLHDEIRQKNILFNKILDRYVADEVLTQIVEDPDKHLHLGGKKRFMTIIFADIRKFTSFSEKHDPQQTVEFLNNVFSKITKIIYKYEGKYIKYFGDGIMVCYDTSSRDKNTVLGALKTAIEMKKVFNELTQQWPDKNSLGLGIGIDSGMVVVGNIGSEKRMEYTVIGNPVNRAQRLQMQASSDQILISDRIYQLVEDQVKVKKKPPIKIKGIMLSMQVYELLEITAEEK
jgi:class 3 adenylate cyclase